MARRKTSRSRAGTALIELLVALGVFGALAAAVTTLSVDALWTLHSGADYAGAVAYAQEGLEAARQIADRSWTLLTSGDHGVTVETAGAETRYAFVGSADTVDIYTRVVNVADVQRDASGNIVLSGGTLDPDTKRITATVSFATGSTRRAASVQLTAYLTNWESFSWTETLQAQFRQGTLTSTEVIAAAEPPADNGSVRLAGAVDWTAPVVRGTFDAAGSGDGRAVVVQNGYAYLVTDDGGDGRLLIINATDVTAPTLAGSVPLGAPGYGLVVSGGYAYVARGSGSGELAVIDIRTPATPTLVRTVDAPGSAAGRSIAGEGALLLLGRNGSGSTDEVHAYTIPSADAANPTAQGSLNLSGDPTVESVVLRSGTAFLATTGDPAELVVVNATAPASLTQQGTLDLSGTTDATGVAVSGPSVYLTRSGGNEFVVADVSNLSRPVVLGELDLGNGANGLAVEGGFAYVAAREQGNEFQRVDAGTPAALSVAGAAAVGAEPKGATFAGNYAFLATAGNDRELVIVGGGEGGWANPTLVGSINLGGNKDGRVVVVAGDYAYIGREKASEGGEFLIYDVSEPRTPTFVGQAEIGDTVRSILLDGHRAYLATYRDRREFQVADVSNPASPRIIATFRVPGNTADGMALYKTGNIVVMTTRANDDTDTADVRDRDSDDDDGPAGMDELDPGPEVLLLDVADPANPILRGQIDFGTNITVRHVTGNSTHMFLATSDNAAEVKIYDIQDPARPVLVGSYNTTGSGEGRMVVLRGTTLFVGTRNNGGGTDPEFFILDVSNPAAPVLRSSGSALDIRADVFGLDVAGTVGFIGTTRRDRGFVTLDLTNLNSPAELGVREMNDSVNFVGVYGTFAFVASDDDNAEVQIFKSADATGFATTGTYDSIQFDSGATTTVWESVSWNAILNSGTLQFQLRRGDTQAALAAATFTGPDGTANTYYTTAGSALTLPNSTDPLPGRWIQWRAFFNGTQVATPELQDLTLTFRR